MTCPLPLGTKRISPLELFEYIVLPSIVILSIVKLSTDGKDCAAYAGPNPEEPPPGWRDAPSDFRIGINPFACVPALPFP